jgi:hypothetical protein
MTTSDPVDLLVPGIEVELRRFVRAAGRRRALSMTAYAGVPAGPCAALDTPAPTSTVHGPDRHLGPDHTLRSDLVLRALEGVPDLAGTCAWVTRSGRLEPRDLDRAWLAAARTGFARLGLQLPAFFVLNRQGWHELIGARRREWSRVRPRDERV